MRTLASLPAGPGPSARMARVPGPAQRPERLSHRHETSGKVAAFLEHIKQQEMLHLHILMPYTSQAHGATAVESVALLSFAETSDVTQFAGRHLRSALAHAL